MTLRTCCTWHDPSEPQLERRVLCSETIDEDPDDATPAGAAHPAAGAPVRCQASLPVGAGYDCPPAFHTRPPMGVDAWDGKGVSIGAIPTKP
jgi:hypothetical protein